jgi:hypothetical protein
MHRHAVADFDAMRQGNSTVQELYNQMRKLVEQMVHLQPSNSTKVVELGYKAE